MPHNYFDRSSHIVAPLWRVPDLTAQTAHRMGQSGNDLTNKAMLQASSPRDLASKPDIPLQGKPLGRSEVNVSYRTYQDRVNEGSLKSLNMPPSSQSQFTTTSMSSYGMNNMHSHRHLNLSQSRGTTQTYLSQGATMSRATGR